MSNFKGKRINAVNGVKTGVFTFDPLKEKGKMLCPMCGKEMVSEGYSTQYDGVVPMWACYGCEEEFDTEELMVVSVAIFVYAL